MSLKHKLTHVLDQIPIGSSLIAHQLHLQRYNVSPAMTKPLLTLVMLSLNKNPLTNRPRSDCSCRSSLIRLYTFCHSHFFFLKYPNMEQMDCSKQWEGQSILGILGGSVEMRAWQRPSKHLVHRLCCQLKFKLNPWRPNTDSKQGSVCANMQAYMQACWQKNI